MSSPQWKPGRSKGSGVGARSEMHAVSGRESERAKVVKGVCVSPRPWRSRRREVGWWEGGAEGDVRWRFDGEKDGSRRTRDDVDG
jgi:hypothetical protein